MRAFFITLCTILFSTGCDNGLEPPTDASLGSIRGVVTYTGEWPEPAAVRELRFVGMPFIPRDTSDFLQLNRLAISDTLARFVTEDRFFLPEVKAGVYVYSGVAENFGRGIIDWRPVGLYEEGDGTFVVRGNETTELVLTIDLNTRPIFPPVID